MRRALVGTLLAVLLLPPLLLWGLVATETGSRILVQAGSQLVPGLTVADVQGTLLGEIRLGAIDYRDGTALQVQLERLSIHWFPSGLLRGRVHLRAVSAAGLLLTLPPPDPRAEQSYPVRLPQRIVPPLALQLERLSLSQVLVRQGQDQWQLERLDLSGRLNREGLYIDTLHFDGAGVRLAASGQVQGEYPYAVSMRLDWQAGLPGMPELAGQGELAGDVSRLTTRQRLRLPHEAELAASVTPDLAAGRHRFEITGEWAELAMALGEETLHSRQGRLALQGEPAGYEMQLVTRIEHPAVAEVLELDISGHGDLDQLLVDQGRLLALGGETRFSGSLGWNPALAWEVILQATAIDPGKQWPEWPGALALEAAVNGSLADGQLQLATDIRRLHGTLRDYPVEGRGQLLWSDERLALRAVKLESGVNRAQLEGALHPGLQLSFEIDASDLQQVAPGLTGRLQGGGHVHGSVADPALQMKLNGSHLELAGLRVDELSLDADIDPAHAAGSYINLHSKQLGFAGIQLDQFAVAGKGNAGQHHITATATGPDVGLEVRAAGGYDGRQWQGTLSGLNAGNEWLGRWQLEQPAGLRIAGAAMQVEPLCLVQDQARLCASARRREDGSLDSSGELSGLPLDLLRNWLAEDTLIEGVVAGSFRVTGKPAQLQAEALLQVSPGTLQYTPLEGPQLVAEHRDGHIGLHYHDDTLEAQLGFGLGDEGRLEGSGQLGPESGGQRALQGELDFMLSDPRPLGALTPQLSGWSGPMSLHGQLGGTLAHPAVQLAGAWRDGAVSVPELGILLSAIHLELESDGERIRLQGRAASGKGEIRLTGETLLDRVAGWPVQLHIEGEDFQVARRSDLEVAVSPDLNIALVGQELNATGELAMPYARIRVADIPAGAAQVSPDEVIVDQRGALEPEESRKALRIRAQLQLTLGDDVRVEAYGLDSRLAGELELHQLPGSPAEAIGQLQLLDGSYTGYGQELVIEQGRLLFAGPVQSANIDVRAVRKVEEVTAGILLSGPLTAPKTQLYSQPPMEEAEILSWLLTGGPLSSGKEIDASALTQAAVGLGLDKTNTITGQITGALGLDELSVEGGEKGLEDSAMAIGKRLSPELYVRYIYGLFDGAATVQLRYRMSEHLRLEVGTGTQQSADILYEIERE